MAKRDFYQVLGIDNSADEREIKRAYKRLAMRYHPDRNQGNKQAEVKFKEVKEAYEVLTNREKRKAYDQYGHSAFEQGNTGNSFESSFTTTADFGDIFGEVFGDIFGSSKQSKRAARGADLQYNLELTLEEAVKGIAKKIRILSLRKCDSCKGIGASSSRNFVSCTTCDGNGQIHMRKGFFSVQQTCPDCYGKGRIIKNPCKFCIGQGRLKKSRTLIVNIPPGVDSNDRIRLNNEGEAGENNASPGDLYVQITVKRHSIFERDGNDLYCEVPISFPIAALGGEVQIPTLDGQIKLKIPKETQSGKLLRMRGKGVCSMRNDKKGDLLCKIIVETPINLNDEQKDLLFKLENSLKRFKNDKNSPKSKRFFDGVKKFFNELTK